MSDGANVPAEQVEETARRWSDQCPDRNVSPVLVLGLLNEARLRLEERLAGALEEHGLRSWEFDVLAALRTEGEPYELCPGTLSLRLGVSNSAMTHRITRLEESGLVERRFSPHNRRIVLVRLTQRGRALTEHAMGSYLSEGGDALAGLTREELDRLCLLLRRLGTSSARHAEE
ncbi:MarR family winged helix-turn-helix transcriptional regulator [Actinopolyspora mortivallis]|uniref:MarR family winged helix-turn-helix transcriptional regulator n=1 Tax=Actinopolyspora mortivallis TaxID=33906 RepID=UPI0015E613E4|nr:MarR family transcriptional regulator [Actinopolyspora mortivallis]